MRSTVFPVLLGGLITFVTWFICSAMMSSEKARTGNYDKTFGFERVLAGDWFCPVKEGK